MVVCASWMCRLIKPSSARPIFSLLSMVASLPTRAPRRECRVTTAALARYRYLLTLASGVQAPLPSSPASSPKKVSFSRFASVVSRLYSCTILLLHDTTPARYDDNRQPLTARAVLQSPGSLLAGAWDNRGYGRFSRIYKRSERF